MFHLPVNLLSHLGSVFASISLPPKCFRMMSAFKRYIQNEEGRVMMNDLLMYLKIENYHSLTHGKTTQKQQTAMSIYKVYFDKSSRRYKRVC